MTITLAAKPAENLTDDHFDATRLSLADLAALGVEELAAQLSRALPGGARGQVPVAAFQSSI
ncbi:FxSxx-COOH cyclophane-containing RiPP peptide [Kitasatospora sp. NPDC048540]|uniref:FxSxx-COOH cyclophane-containing RiPP peptide n=1 Tax=unclassified Kitasatospora TaxID=2633591 RepID=UPI00053ADFC2|nr:FxSxx-COOH cyclophane-containing RiPP peptide [Kitasatospora sp. MBT63]